MEQTESRATGRVDRRALAAIMVAIAAAALWWLAPWHNARPIVLQGTAESNGPRTSIWFEPDSRWEALRFGLSHNGEGFALEGAWWSGADDVWHDTVPVECLDPGGTRVELGFIRMRYGAESPGGPTRRVTSIRCLE